ncbi:MAG: TIGR00282 family metallophosphoesterase [Aquificota bacterium]|nr:MAG: TIGR00282 family metallophosphoesterase [Aquificota bacterium]
MRFLLLGDIIGRTGRNALKKFLPDLIEEYKIDFVIANAENAAGGFGLTPKVYNQLINMKIDVLTSGNHIFDKKEVLQIINKDNIIRPANYPPDAPGKGYNIFEKDDKKIAVINLMGRVFMGIPLDCPFRKFDEIYEKIKNEVDYIIVDFHAEATSEKMAFGYYVDGRADIVFGTHSHVSTADERILPKGTVYITDIGLTGAYHSVIGMKIEEPIKKFLTGIGKKYEVSTDGFLLNALFVEKENGSIRIEKIKKEDF